MVVIVLEHAPDKLRGELTRWLIEPKAGVYVGRISAMVREKLWEHICMDPAQDALLIYSAKTEQGYDIRINGSPDRTIVDLEGVKSIRILYF